MSKPVTIGILSPFNEGDFFGGILQGAHELACRFNCRLLTVRTNGENNLFDFPLAFDHVDGWVMISSLAVNERLLKMMMDLGKPIVGAGGNLKDETRFPVVLPDNFYGMKLAVKHLIEHGHRRIAFAGCTRFADVSQRYEGYCAALEEAGIARDPNLAFLVSSNLHLGGDEAAEQLIASGIPCTAVACATDANAVQIVQSLRQVGYRVPEDIAVIGFDDYESTKLVMPDLSSTRNPTYELGYTAAYTLLQMIRGEGKPQKQIYLKSEFHPRSSCGCEQPLFEPHVASDKEHQLKSQYLGNVIRNQQAIGKKLINARSQDIKNLSCFLNTHISWACLGLWEEGAKEKTHLIVDGYLDKNAIHPFKNRCPLEKFPPEPLLASVGGRDGYITLNPIRSENKEWGVLALFENMKSLNYNYDTISHYLDLLASALEREALHEIVRTSEKKFRILSEQLEIVSRTAVDGTWDWHIPTDEFVMGDQIVRILGIPRDGKKFGIRDLIRLIHPKEMDKVFQSMQNHIRHLHPFQMEFRVRRSDGRYIWIYASGEAIRDELGKPLRMVGSIRDINHHKEAEETIMNLAYHDSLTGLANRRLFTERLKDNIRQARQKRQKLCVMLLDLDRFKLINDSHGHQVGDKLLKYAAGLLKDHTPKEYTVARLGGDEFILLIPQVKDENDVISSGMKILELMNIQFAHEEKDFHITGSLGISIFPRDGEDPDTLIKCADIAMYRAKAEGRNKFQLFTQSMNELSKERFELETNLRAALKNNEFVLHFQPLVDFQDGRVNSAEVLIRWQSPERGMVFPGTFIPIAEETGLIIPMGYWVIAEACRQNMIWQREGYPPLRLSINLSSRQFLQSDFVTKVKDILDETGLDPSLLSFEITERTAIQNMEVSNKNLEQLIEMGIFISIDDFGTGYSSLSLLKQLPIQMVKIDQSFIRDMTADEDNQAIVNAIMAMAHSLQLTVAAEGVETLDQLRILREQGCDLAQGYYIGRPQPNDRFMVDFLKHGGRFSIPVQSEKSS